MFTARCAARCQRHLPQQRHLHRAVPTRCSARLVAPSTLTASALVGSSPIHPVASRTLHTTLTGHFQTTRQVALHSTLTSPLHTTPSSPLHTTLTGGRQPRQADPDYEIIYRFPYINTVRFICRLKIYQTGLTLAAVPVMGVLQDVGAATKLGAVGMFAAGMLYIMGEFFRRFVGLVYLHKDGTHLKVAHLTFWGGRRDTVLLVSDVVPFSELTDSPTDVYLKLRRYSNRETFYVSLRYGGVTSRQKLEAVFGPIEGR